MKNSASSLVVAVTTISSLLCFAAVGSATQLDSTAFNHQYNGDVYPLPNYVENPTIVDQATDGDILTYRAPQGGGYWQSSDWSGSHNPGFTVEFRIKIDTNFADASKGAVALYYGDGSAGDIFSVGKNVVWSGVGAETIDTNDNTDGYHTFRISEGTNGSQAPINMYRDGVLIKTYPNGGNFGANVLYFGSGGSIFGGPTVHLDYLRWDNTGAYEPVPVPEPVSCLSLAVGALGMLVGYRRSKCCVTL